LPPPPGEKYRPERRDLSDRGRGVSHFDPRGGRGLCSLVRQIGAVLTAFLFPILLKDIGTDLLLLILVGTSLVGALVTWRYAIETKGINLENIDDKGMAAPAAGQ
jgi:MFS transporter, putative metabolite transport protein